MGQNVQNKVIWIFRLRNSDPIRSGIVVQLSEKINNAIVFKVPLRVRQTHVLFADSTILCDLVNSLLLILQLFDKTASLLICLLVYHQLNSNSRLWAG